MGVWEILGIEPTDEARKIKRAYSKKITTCHPEDDPEGFQKLQRAYELALSYARGEIALLEVDDEDGEADDLLEGVSVAWYEDDPDEDGEADDAADRASVYRHASDEPAARGRRTESPLHADASGVRAEAAGRLGGPESDEGFSYIGDFIRAQEAAENALLEQASGELLVLEQLIEEDGDVVGFFSSGIYGRYHEIEGFDELLAEILEPYVAQLPILDVPDLEEAIGYDEDGTSPLVAMFTERYLNANPVKKVKGLFEGLFGRRP